MKRRKWNRNIDSIALIKSTEGFNGADIESAVKNAIELAFIEKREFLTTDDLLDIINDTKSISVTLKDKIAKIKAMIEKVDIRLASREHTESRSESESAGKESAHGFNVTKRRHSGKIQEACKSKGAAFKVTRLGNSDSFRVDIPKGTNLSEWTVITKSTCRISTVGNCSNILSVNEPGWGERMLLGSAQKGHTRFNGLQVILERYSGIAPRDLYFIYQYV